MRIIDCWVVAINLVYFLCVNIMFDEKVLNEILNVIKLKQKRQSPIFTFLSIHNGYPQNDLRSDH